MNSTRRLTGSVVLLSAIVALATMAQAADSDNASKEKELIEKLRSNSPAAEKAIACKQLAVYGSSQAVPELAKLLPDERNLPRGRGSRSKRFLVRKPAKRCARRLDSLKGRLLVGTINSIGVRRDDAAVDPLTVRLQGPGRRRRLGCGRGFGADRKCRRDQDTPRVVGRRRAQSPHGGRRRLHPLRRASDGRRKDERSGGNLRRSAAGRGSQAKDHRGDSRSDSRAEVRRNSALDRATSLGGPRTVPRRLEHRSRACRP